jgi:hypothetical protein
VGIGAFLYILDLLQSAVRGPGTPPMFPGALFALTGFSSAISSLLVAFGSEVTDSLLIFFVLFVSRVVLRKEWIAVLATVAIVSAIDFLQGAIQLANLPFEIAYLTILTIVMLRLGLIAAIFAYATKQILHLPHTLDWSAWYAGATMVPLILLALLAIYGFRTSLGGRRLIQLPD